MKESQKVITFTEYESVAELSETDQKLLEAACLAMHGAYAPYSGFNVGAAVKAACGDVLTGSNQETANYKGSCAEKTALDQAGTRGHRLTGGITDIAIIGKPKNQESTEPICPCGQCRQDLKEWQDLSNVPIRIIMASTSGRILVVSGIDSLLPFAFGPADLGISKRTLI